MATGRLRMERARADVERKARLRFGNSGVGCEVTPFVLDWQWSGRMLVRSSGGIVTD
jgi:hypothetical protein